MMIFGEQFTIFHLIGAIIIIFSIITIAKPKKEEKKLSQNERGLFTSQELNYEKIIP
jgi:drug/metabolite transporter (DMT)-like permease